MKYSRTGLVLCTENYDECVRFYNDTLGLPILHVLDDVHSKLTTLDFGGNCYLMIETGGRACSSGKSVATNPIWLRFNVDDVEESAQLLRENRLEVKIRHEVWGTIADFLDPDGNRCSLREESTFG